VLKQGSLKPARKNALSCVQDCPQLFTCSCHRSGFEALPALLSCPTQSTTQTVGVRGNSLDVHVTPASKGHGRDRCYVLAVPGPTALEKAYYCIDCPSLTAIS